jgi:membrane-bound metal-dependent hydrolase YbcI (DUF457 family)
MTDIIAITFLVLFALFFGYRTAQSSKKRESIQGGTLSEVFHFLSGAIMATLTPTILVSIFVFRLPLLQLVGLALGLFALSLLCAFLHAIAEKPALKPVVVDDTGWTEEDARTSGL